MISNFLEKLACLLAVPGIGNNTLTKFWQTYGPDEKLLRAIYAGRNLDKIFSDKQIDNFKLWQQNNSLSSLLKFWQEERVQLKTWLDEDYPPLLKEIPDPPLFLFFHGEWPDKWSNSVAMVGSRNPSKYGIEATAILVEQLKIAGCELLVSGGMYGIDFLVHELAAKNSIPSVAFLGYGHGCWYPSFMYQKYAALLSKGLTLVSQYPPGVPSQRHQFIQRNRLIAGSTWGTVIVQAAQKSGTLNTANWALDYGREVMIVPGPITDERSNGTTNLWLAGATPVTNGWQIMKCGPSYLVQNHNETIKKKILKQLKKSPSSLEKLQREMKVDPQILKDLLFNMELSGTLSVQWGVYKLV